MSDHIDFMCCAQRARARVCVYVPGINGPTWITSPVQRILGVPVDRCVRPIIAAPCIEAGPLQQRILCVWIGVFVGGLVRVIAAAGIGRVRIDAMGQRQCAVFVEVRFQQNVFAHVGGGAVMVVTTP